MNVLDLFSGIGGFSLGLERAGMDTVAFCESDKFCRRVLRKHWPDLPIHHDIRELDGHRYAGSVQLVCGGFPCQPFSNAGNQRGAEDDRALWPEMFRVICECKPAWVIGENVTGIVSMELDNCISDLEGAGYSVQTFDIPACGIDAYHIRHRIWIVAHANGERIRQQSGGRIGQDRAEAAQLGFFGEDGANANGGDSNGRPGQPKRKPERRNAADRDRADDPDANGRGFESERQPEHGEQQSPRGGKSDRLRESGWWARKGQWFVGDTISTGLEGYAGDGDGSGEPGRIETGTGGSVGPPSLRNTGRGSGEGPGPSFSRWARPSGWEPEPDVGRVATGIPNRVDRLRGLGNSVVPGLVEVLGRAILEIDGST